MALGRPPSANTKETCVRKMAAMISRTRPTIYGCVNEGRSSNRAAMMEMPHRRLANYGCDLRHQAGREQNAQKQHRSCLRDARRSAKFRCLSTPESGHNPCIRELFRCENSLRLFERKCGDYKELPRQLEGRKVRQGGG